MEIHIRKSARPFKTLKTLRALRDYTRKIGGLTKVDLFEQEGRLQLVFVDGTYTMFSFPSAQEMMDWFRSCRAWRHKCTYAAQHWENRVRVRNYRYDWTRVHKVQTRAQQRRELAQAIYEFSR